MEALHYGLPVPISWLKSCAASGLVTVVMQFLSTEMFQAMLTTISFTTVQGIKTRRENYSVFIHQVLVIISLGVLNPAYSSTASVLMHNGDMHASVNDDM